MGAPATDPITALGDRIGAGEAAADEMLPLVYAELRRLARARLARDRATGQPGPTSLVHQAYVRLVGDREYRWANRKHFFAAAAEAMRRIVIDRARRRASIKHGGANRSLELDEQLVGARPRSEELLALDQAMTELEQQDATMALVVKLRYFAGTTVPETAEALQISERTVNRHWTAARAWLHDRLVDP